jgi:transposase-like protein
MDETYVKVRGQWKYPYRAVDKDADTIDFPLRAHRDKAAARRYFEKSIDQNGLPEMVTIDGSSVNLASEWHRDHAHDCQRADEIRWQKSSPLQPGSSILYLYT